MAYNPYAVQPRTFAVAPGGDISGALKGIGTIVEEKRQREKEEAVKAKAEAKFNAFKEKASKAMREGDDAAMAELMLEYPEARQVFTDFGKVRDKNQADFQAEVYRQAVANPERAVSILKQGMEEGREKGINTDNLARNLSNFGSDPKNYDRNITAMKMELAVLDPVYAKQQAEERKAAAELEKETRKQEAAAAKGQKKTIGSSYVIKDKEGNMWNMTRSTDPITLDTKTLYSPIGDAPEKPGSKVEIVSGGETSEEKLTRQTAAKRALGAAQEMEIEEQIEEQQEEIRTADFTQNLGMNILNDPEILDDITGYTGMMPTLTPTGKASEAAFNQFKNNLTLTNLGKMSGVLSESDIQILANAASGLEIGMDEGKMRETINFIVTMLEDKKREYRDKIARRKRKLSGGVKPENGKVKRIDIQGNLLK